MAKSFGLAWGAALLALAMPVRAQGPQVLGSDAAQCRPGAGGAAALITITGFKDRQGLSLIHI